MSFTPGDKLGPYEIVEPIGKGGMGAVYRARDTRLGRDVAIKVSDQKFSERFEREARVISSLNHPNICTLFDVGPNYLVMELVEGQTLSERIKEGAIPLEESLNIARQIADALEAAHEKGIVHRDLKPGNVIVKEDGSVKVLDFGLAKVAPTAKSASDSPDPELSPTISMAATQAGVILGTAAYMAPEQARGKVVDKRADIWAFGVVLYEMVTGKKLFKGEDLTDTLASVIKSDPDLSAAPPELRPLLAKCLEKDPRKRLRDISGVELLLDVRQVDGPPQSGGLLHKTWIWPAAAALALVAGLALGGAWYASSQPEQDRPLVRLNVDLGPDVSLSSGLSRGNVVISPDGARLVYDASVSGGPDLLYIRRLDEDAATALPGTEGARAPFFSPDGQWVAFAANGKLNKISVEGGPVFPLADVPVNSFSGGDWTADGFIIFGEANLSGLLRIPEAGGERTVVAALGVEQLAFQNPQGLPGGRAILFSVDNATGPNSVEVLNLASGERKTLAPGGSTARYLPSGHLIYQLDGTLFAVPFDVDRLEMGGTPIPILTDVDYNTVDAAWISVSRNGTLVYRSGEGPDSSTPGLSTVEWLDAAGNREAILGAPGDYAQPKVSPDGRRLVLAVGDGPNSNRRILIYDMERGGFSPLTFDDAPYSYPVWHPDGRFVVFLTGGVLRWARADGANQPQDLLENRGVGTPTSFIPDGSRLAFTQFANLDDLWTVPITVEGDTLQAGAPERFLATPFVESVARFSPDGHWIAYASNESGRDEVYVRAFPPPATGVGAKFSVSTGGAVAAHWSSNGDELFFVSDAKIMVASYRVNGENFVADRPRVWATLDGDLTGASVWDIASDGRALIRVPVRSDEPQAAPGPQHHVVFLQNFFDELRRRVPVDGK